MARDTVEERIYGLLDQKLGDIARTIGKIDPATGQPLEDFRSDILGFLGSSPNYHALYMKALVDKDFKRTEREIEEALKNAKEACEAVNSLTQDLSTFNLQDYLQIEGRVTLSDLKEWAEHGILRLGGTVLPNDEAFKVEVPAELMNGTWKFFDRLISRQHARRPPRPTCRGGCGNKPTTAPSALCSRKPV